MNADCMMHGKRFYIDPNHRNHINRGEEVRIIGIEGTMYSPREYICEVIKDGSITWLEPSSLIQKPYLSFMRG